MVLRGSDQIAKLTQLSLEADLVEQLDQVNVVAGVLKVLFQKDEDAGLQDERVVDGNGANTVLAVPAWLTATSNRGIHHIVGDKEIGLQLTWGKRGVGEDTTR